jgi:hypothetical protein
MQTNWSALKSSLVLGTIWTAWHLPFWAILDELSVFGWFYWVMNWIWILAVTIYITWIMNNTGNSLLMAFLLHWTFNMVSVGFLPVTTVKPAYWILIILSWAISINLLRLYGPKHLIRVEAKGF